MKSKPLMRLVSVAVAAGIAIFAHGASLGQESNLKTLKLGGGSFTTSIAQAGRPEIRKLEDLKGKKIGISSLGSAGDLIFGYVLRKYGIDANREILTASIKKMNHRRGAEGAE